MVSHVSETGTMVTQQEEILAAVSEGLIKAREKGTTMEQKLHGWELHFRFKTTNAGDRVDLVAIDPADGKRVHSRLALTRKFEQRCAGEPYDLVKCEAEDAPEAPNATLQEGADAIVAVCAPAVGTRVLHYFEDAGWCPGVVAEAMPSGQLAIAFDDGTREEGIDPYDVRLEATHDGQPTTGVAAASSSAGPDEAFEAACAMGDLVLGCDAKNIWWEARVIAVDEHGKLGRRLKLHFLGWKATHDLWVPGHGAGGRVRPLPFGSALVAGDSLEALSDAGEWSSAKVLDVREPKSGSPRFVLVHYVDSRGRSENAAPLEDEWIDVKLGRLRPPPIELTCEMGTRVRACDRFGTWCDAKVIDVREAGGGTAAAATAAAMGGGGASSEPRQLRVHFLGWSAKYDEWIYCGTGRVRQTHASVPEKPAAERVKQEEGSAPPSIVASNTTASNKHPRGERSPTRRYSRHNPGPYELRCAVGARVRVWHERGGKWKEATVVDVREAQGGGPGGELRRLQVRFLGLSARYDEWIDTGEGSVVESTRATDEVGQPWKKPRLSAAAPVAAVVAAPAAASTKKSSAGAAATAAATAASTTLVRVPSPSGTLGGGGSDAPLTDDGCDDEDDESEPSVHDSLHDSLHNSLLADYASSAPSDSRALTAIAAQRLLMFAEQPREIDREIELPFGLGVLRQQLVCPMCTQVCVRPHVLPCQHAYCEDCLSNLARSTWPTSHCLTCKVPFTRRDCMASQVLDGIVRAFHSIVGRATSSSASAEVAAVMQPPSLAVAAVPAAAVPAAPVPAAPVPAAPQAGEQVYEERDEEGKLARWQIGGSTLALLEQVFLVEQCPSVQTRRELSTKLNVSARQVQVWFQNKRQRERKQARGKGVDRMPWDRSSSKSESATQGPGPTSIDSSSASHLTNPVLALAALAAGHPPTTVSSSAAPSRVDYTHRGGDEAEKLRPDERRAAKHAAMAMAKSERRVLKENQSREAVASAAQASINEEQEEAGEAQAGEAQAGEAQVETRKRVERMIPLAHDGATEQTGKELNEEEGAEDEGAERSYRLGLAYRCKVCGLPKKGHECKGPVVAADPLVAARVAAGLSPVASIAMAAVSPSSDVDSDVDSAEFAAGTGDTAVAAALAAASASIAAASAVAGL